MIIQIIEFIYKVNLTMTSYTIGQIIFKMNHKSYWLIKVPT